jgi:hypothetical protein
MRRKQYTISINENVANTLRRMRDNLNECAPAPVWTEEELMAAIVEQTMENYSRADHSVH